MDRVKISVKNLVGFILRGGSIDNRFSGNDRALEGARIHRKLQKMGGAGYKPEVSLSLTTEHKGITYVVDGRADGVITEDDAVTIDEIKTVVMPLELISENYSRMHWAQAMCYAYIYAEKNGLNSISVRLTYYNVDTDQIKRFVREQSTEQLKDFFSDVLEKYKKWADFEIAWNKIKVDSAKNLKFPFDNYRKGQRELAACVYRTIDEGQTMFCQAPTGIGKTVSTLFPSIKAIGEGKGQKIFYLTAKTTTRQIAENALDIMRGRDLRMKSITLTAKDKVCPLEKRVCNPEACKYADGHFDRANDCIYEIITTVDSITKDAIVEYSEKYTVCPHELALDLTYWCDCIICDYNHVFDPTAKIARFFEEAGDFIFLVDEAHNLVDRARGMFSANMFKSDIMLLRRAFDKGSRQYKQLTKINTTLRDLRKKAEDNNNIDISVTVPLELIDDLFSFVFSCEEWLKNEQDDEVLDAYFRVNNFLKISEFYDERYVTFAEADGSDVEIMLYCIDPSFLLRQGMDMGRATILFSATLTPVEYFISILGGDDDSKQLILKSPFDRDNLCLMVANRISTKYKKREASVPDIVEMIYSTAAARAGNYIAFFPSYKYMKDVYGAFIEEYPEVNTTIQDSRMSEEERADFLAKFDSDSTGGLIGFCVLGGVFSEGIDLEGERLIGAMIIGVGLPQINRRQDIIAEYFNEQNGRGFDYAYKYPGMNKVLQAAGRVIRSDNDRGVVLLIDERFTTEEYLELFPGHWSDYSKVRTYSELEAKTKDFWRGI